MNKRYIDFVPSKTAKTSAKPSTVARRAVNTSARTATVRRTVATSTKATTSGAVPKARKPASKKAPMEKPANFSLASGVKLGVVEDLNPKFVKTDVPKRPLSEPGDVARGKSDLATAKSKKVGLIKGARLPKITRGKVEKPVEKSTDGAKSTYKAPVSPFINQNKVEKRPLSKNVYQKKIVTPKEEPKGPVTIISKPEKDAHVSLIVTIILTIILGAAAGTVAFLLLPK